MYTRKVVLVFLAKNGTRVAVIVDFSIPDGVPTEEVFRSFDKYLNGYLQHLQKFNREPVSMKDVMLLTKEAVEKKFGCICTLTEADSCGILMQS